MIYKEIIKSKNNFDIPVLLSGKAMHSKYDPSKEGESFGSDLGEKCHFAIVLGLGGSYHILPLAQKREDIFFLVIENSKEDLEFLNTIPSVKKILSLKNVKVTFVNELKESLLKEYIPALYGDLSILKQRIWCEENAEYTQKILEKIKECLALISADFSVQSHFGSIWQRNFFINLQLIKNYKSPSIKQLPTHKTAAIIAAGPSLDSHIEELIKNRDSYYIIATDTAFLSLSKYKIISDAVLSIDAQNISANHFRGNIDSKTIFVLPLCGNTNATLTAVKNRCPLLFAKTGHPLEELVDSLSDKSFLLPLNSGSGTVTIAALDFAEKMGFENIIVFGADFSYKDCKPYAKGTYLETLYRIKDNKIHSAENDFVHLMYRTEIFKNDKKSFTTPILQSYKNSFLAVLLQNKIDYYIKNDTYVCNKKNIDNKQNYDMEKYFSYPKDFQKLKNYLENEKICKTHLLPYIAFLQNHEGKNLSISELTKLAYSKILRYTNIL